MQGMVPKRLNARGRGVRRCRLDCSRRASAASGLARLACACAVPAPAPASTGLATTFRFVPPPVGPQAWLMIRVLRFGFWGPGSIVAELTLQIVKSLARSHSSANRSRKVPCFLALDAESLLECVGAYHTQTHYTCNRTLST